MKPQGTQLSLFETRSSSDPFAVRVSPRARRLTARVHVGGRVEIVVPVGVNAHAVRDFVQRFTPWIDRKVAAMQCFAAAGEPVPESIEFAVTGERFAVRMAPAATRGLVQRRRPDRGARRRTTTGRARCCSGWLKRAADERLAPRLLQLADELELFRGASRPSVVSAPAGAAARRAAR